MTTARTRPGLVREAFLDGRIYWESSGVNGFLRQWFLSVSNSHPVCLLTRSHRLSPLSASARCGEGFFQLISGFIGTSKPFHTLIDSTEYFDTCFPIQQHFSVLHCCSATHVGAVLVFIQELLVLYNLFGRDCHLFGNGVFPQTETNSSRFVPS